MRKDPVHPILPLDSKRRARMLKKRKKKRNCHALCFSKDGPYRLIRRPCPTSPDMKLHSSHSHAHESQGHVLYWQNNPPQILTQTSQAVADLSTSACGRLRSNMITICLVNSGPILPTFLMALSTLRLAQVKTSCLKSICLSAAKGTWKPVVNC